MKHVKVIISYNITEKDYKSKEHQEGKKYIEGGEALENFRDDNFDIELIDLKMEFITK